MLHNQDHPVLLYIYIYILFFSVLLHLILMLTPHAWNLGPWRDECPLTFGQRSERTKRNHWHFSPFAIVNLLLLTLLLFSPSLSLSRPSISKLSSHMDFPPIPLCSSLFLSFPTPNLKPLSTKKQKFYHLSYPHAGSVT